MKRLLKGFAGLALLALFVLPVLAEGAEAQVRFNVAVNTPNIRVRVGNDSFRHSRVHRTVPRPVRIDRYVREDRQIAIRLAVYAGVRQRKLIRLRRQGYRWFEIGRMYHIPARVVRAAMNPRGWDRFCKNEMRIGRKGQRHHSRVVFTNGR